MAFDPLKNSFHSFQISLEFKVCPDVELNRLIQFTVCQSIKVEIIGKLELNRC